MTQQIESKAAATAMALGSPSPPQDTFHPMVTTSSVLAVKYKDGVIMVADTLASYGRMCRYKDIERFSRVGKTTLISCSGEFSDYQMLQRQLLDISENDILQYDNINLNSKDIGNYCARFMHMKRTRFTPYWLSIIVAGYINKRNSVNGDNNGGPYLGYTDIYGTFYEENVLATGLGRYFAITLMRERQRADMTEEEARALLEECMQILFYRDCAASNRVQFAKVTEEGVEIDEPKLLDSKWDFKAYTGKTMEMSMIGCSW